MGNLPYIDIRRYTMAASECKPGTNLLVNCWQPDTAWSHGSKLNAANMAPFGELSHATGRPCAVRDVREPQKRHFSLEALPEIRNFRGGASVPLCRRRGRRRTIARKRRCRGALGSCRENAVSDSLSVRARSWPGSGKACRVRLFAPAMRQLPCEHLTTFSLSLTMRLSSLGSSRQKK